MSTRHYTLNSKAKQADDRAIARQATRKLTDLSPMPFGQYKGKSMQDVPAGYLLWLREQKCRDPLVAAYIEDNLSALCDECPDYIPE